MSQLKEYSILPQHVVHLDGDARDPDAAPFQKEQLDRLEEPAPVPSICGLPLKYVS